jgi:hypothetical protein
MSEIRPYQWFDNCPAWLWRMLPRSYRRKIVYARADYEKSPLVLQSKWDAFRAERANNTVRDIIDIRWSDEPAKRAWLASNGLTGDELASDVFGPDPETPPEWFGLFQF